MCAEGSGAQILGQILMFGALSDLFQVARQSALQALGQAAPGVRDCLYPSLTIEILPNPALVQRQFNCALQLIISSSHTA